MVLFSSLPPIPTSVPSIKQAAICTGKPHFQWHPTPVLLPGKSHGRRSLVGCSPWGRQESDTTERLPFHFSLSCTGEGNGNPLQCSCLENPRDRGAWWAAVSGVAQSRTRRSDLAAATALYFTSQILRCFFFLQIKGCGNPTTSKSIGTISPPAFAHFVSLCHILVILTIFQAFLLLLYS